MLNFCSSKVDESGSSIADHLLDVDMGGAGPGAPAMPTTAAELTKMQRLRSGRARSAYGIIIKHILLDTDLMAILRVLATSSRAMSPFNS